MTLEEWADLPEDEPGELVDGYLVEDEVTDYVHECVTGFFVAPFRAWVRPPRGLVGASDAKFAVPGGRGRKPDLSVYLPGERRPPGRAALITVAPSILVEVVSRRPRDQRRDRVEKLDEYARFGVRHYWIVDPANRMLEIYELGADARYVRALSAADGLVVDVPGCPGLEIDLDALWAEVDALEQEQGQ